MPQENTNLRERSRNDIKEPKKYCVVFHNDDFTPMDFVVMLLMAIFNKTTEEAEHLMMKVHMEGMAVVGTYSYDIAMTKASYATELSRSEGFPLRITVRPA